MKVPCEERQTGNADSSTSLPLRPDRSSGPVALSKIVAIERNAGSSDRAAPFWALGMTEGMDFMELSWAGRYRPSTLKDYHYETGGMYGGTSGYG